MASDPNEWGRRCLTGDPGNGDPGNGDQGNALGMWDTMSHGTQPIVGSQRGTKHGESPFCSPGLQAEGLARQATLSQDVATGALSKRVAWYRLQDLTS